MPKGKHFILMESGELGNYEPVAGQEAYVEK